MRRHHHRHHHHRHHHGVSAGIVGASLGLAAGAAVGIALAAQPPVTRTAYRRPVVQRTVVVQNPAVVQRTVLVQPQPVVQTVMAPTIAPQPVAPPGYTAVQVRVPAGVYPGQTFQMNFSGRQMAIACPATATAGSLITVNVPNAVPAATPAVPTASYPTAPMPTAVPTAAVAQKTRVKVTVPVGVYPGMQFQATAMGRKFMVTCPPSGQPGGIVEIEI